MLRRTMLYAVLVASLAALGVGFATARPAQSATAPVRIMPLGDSITASPGCWRAILWHDLQTNGYTNVDFVGSVLGNGCNYGYSYDPDNEGHAGYLATNIANQNQLPGWLSAAKPDIVLMHLGTNDVWSSLPTNTILAAYTKLVGQMRAGNPSMKILVAQILPMNPSGCGTCSSGVVALDQAIPGWAAGLTTTQSPIIVVDQYTGFNDATDTIGDGVHPNDTGFQKMAARWYPPLAQVLNGLNPQPSPSATPSSTSASASPSPSPSTSASASPSPSASASAGGPGCTATYRVTNQWPGGFQSTVTVTNTSAAASSAWTATFAFANGQQITQSWSAALTQSGATVTAHNAAYNGTLAPGASTSFGFLATWQTSNAQPAVACKLS
jgi:lysophospholipase L1-like esterase